MAYSYLIETAEALFLVDGGMAGTGRNVLKRIKRIGRKPEELQFAIITHAHADHYGGLAVVQEASGCSIVCHPAHAHTVRTGGGIVSPGINFFGKIYERIAVVALKALRLKALKRVVTVEHGTGLHALGLSGTILHTPGHSSGDLSLVLDDGSAFVGDLVQGPRIPRILPPEFSIMAVDGPAMITSWRALLDSGARTLYPGHGSVVGIGRIVPVFRRALSRSASPVPQADSPSA